MVALKILDYIWNNLPAYPLNVKNQ